VFVAARGMISVAGTALASMQRLRDPLPGVHSLLCDKLSVQFGHEALRGMLSSAGGTYLMNSSSAQNEIDRFMFCREWLVQLRGLFCPSVETRHLERSLLNMRRVARVTGWHAVCGL